MELPFSGQLIHLAALCLVLLIAYAVWTALRLPRLPAVMPSPSTESGRPQRAQGKGNASSGGRTHPGNSPNVPPQPSVPSQPSSTKAEEETTSAEEQPPAPVEFSIYAPSKVPAGQPFDIR